MIISISFLREEESLVDIFAIEMLVVMVNSLQLAHKDNKSLGKESNLSAFTSVTMVTSDPETN